MIPGHGFRMQMFPAVPAPAFTSFLFRPRLRDKFPSAAGPALPGFMASSAGLVVHSTPPVSVCHQVSTITASPLPTTFVKPFPHFRFDGLADGGHVLEVVVIFLRLVAASFAQHTDGGGRSVKNVYVEALGDAPGAAGVRELRHTFVQHAGGGERRAGRKRCKSGQ